MDGHNTYTQRERERKRERGGGERGESIYNCNAINWPG